MLTVCLCYIQAHAVDLLYTFTTCMLAFGLSRRLVYYEY